MEKKDAAIENKARYRSMWRARKEKKSARFLHSSNYRAGIIEINEHHLNRTGIRGRKRYCVWCGVGFLLAIALANLVLNLVLIVTLQLYPGGLPYMVFSNMATIFPEATRISTLELSGNLSGYYNRSISMAAPSFDIHSGTKRIDLSTGKMLNSSQILIDSSSGIHVKPYSQFRVISPVGDQEVLILNRSAAWFRSPLSATNLHTDSVIARSIQAIDSMKVNCSATAAISGCSIKAREGIHINSINNSITLNSSNGDIRFALREPSGGFVVTSQQGNNLNLQLPKLPEFGAGTEGTGTRLCICENGRVFRSSGTSCLIRTTEISNPCAEIE